jgi:Tfp pilus assembly protein PilN
MIRTNLSTRPFYNERAVHLWLLVVAALVVAATIFNVTRIQRYSHSDTELATSAGRDEARAAELRQQASRLRSTVDPRQIEFASAEARQANELIDRRTFSWTELLNRLEMTQPDNVRLVAVRPHVDKDRRIVLTINVVARAVDDVDQFMTNLDETGAFANLRPVVDRVNEDGLLEATLEGEYVPSAARVDEKESGKSEDKDNSARPEEKENAKPDRKDRQAPKGAPQS